MHTIVWERFAYPEEVKPTSLRAALISLAFAGYLSLIDLSRHHEITFVTWLLFGYGVYEFYRFLFVPASMQANRQVSCSLEMVDDGFIYTKNKVKKFLFLKDIKTIAANGRDIVLNITGFKDAAKQFPLYIPVEALHDISKEDFIKEITTNLPAENTIKPYVVTVGYPKTLKDVSLLPVIFGIVLVLILVVVLTSINLVLSV